MAFIICDWHFAKEQGSGMDALSWAYSIIMLASAAFIFIENIFSFGERPSARGYRPKPKPVYDEYGYIVKQPRETAPRNDGYYYEQPRPKPRRENLYEDEPAPQPRQQQYYQEQRPAPQPREQQYYQEPRPAPQEYRQAPAPRPAPAMEPRPAPVEPRPAPRPAPVAQPQQASQMAQGEVDAARELKRLKFLLDEGMITKEEYEEKRKKYLDLL